MINAIIEGISNNLYEEFGYENHMEEIKQDLKEPCFFISSLSPKVERYPGKRYKRGNSFVIQYFPESKGNANAECNEVAERMNWCLETIPIQGESIRGTQMYYDIIDGVLQFFVNYDCFVHRVESKVRMGSLQSMANVKG